MLSKRPDLIIYDDIVQCHSNFSTRDDPTSPHYQYPLTPEQHLLVATVKWICAAWNDIERHIWFQQTNFYGDPYAMVQKQQPSDRLAKPVVESDSSANMRVLADLANRSK